MAAPGISRAYACALTETLDELIAAPGASEEVRRRAQWLKWAIAGYKPGQEPLEFIADARSVMPDGPCSSVTASIE